MSFVVFLLFFAQTQYRWVDQTEKISMGFEFPMRFEFPTSTYQEIIFTDLDQDGDQDMIRSYGNKLQAFENYFDEAGNHLWKENPILIYGINPEGEVLSLGADDLNGNGNDEIVVRVGNSLIGYTNVDTAWVAEPSLFETIDESFVPWYPDFADVDSDGDMDMVGGWGTYPMDLFAGFWWNAGKPQHPKWQFDSTYVPVDRDPPFHPDFLEHFEHPNWIDWNNDGTWDILYTQWFWADPPPYPCYIHILVNIGSGNTPIWEDRQITLLERQDDITVLDWNKDSVEDLLLTAYEHVEGYHYIPGERSGNGILFDFSHPFIWGGIIGYDPSAADVNSDGIPELALTTCELYPFLENWSIVEYFVPFLRTYRALNPEITSWQFNGGAAFWNSTGEPLEWVPSQLQYVDFGNDKLIDYVRNIDEKISLFRNHGTSTQPTWIEDASALSDLPPLFPACFLDIDHDRDMDAVGVPAGDSTLAGYINTRSDDVPNYMRYGALITGLEGLQPAFMSAADIDGDGYTDLAVNLKGDVVAYFNTKLGNPRWERHDEVFASIPGTGTPCLCDGDGDGDLDLFIVQGGRLRYYRNASDEPGVAEEKSVIPDISIDYVGHEVVIKLNVNESMESVELYLYNVVGQRVEKLEATPKQGIANFVIAEQSGIYFYRVITERQEFKGKVLIY